MKIGDHFTVGVDDVSLGSSGCAGRSRRSDRCGNLLVGNPGGPDAVGGTGSGLEVVIKLVEVPVGVLDRDTLLGDP